MLSVWACRGQSSGNYSVPEHKLLEQYRERPNHLRLLFLAVCYSCMRYPLGSSGKHSMIWTATDRGGS